MKSNRREFMKQAGVAGAAVIAAGCSTTGTTQVADSSPRRTAGGPMPRKMTFVSMIVDGTPALGVKSERGILDVRRAAMHHGSAAPTTIDELIRYGDGGLGELVRMANAQGGAGVFHDESAVRFGPCVMNPEKIVCVGLNYARHARETNNPIPKLPILFNKFNNALNCHQGTVQVSKIPATNFDYESELVIVMGRKAQNVSEADALSYVFGYCNGNDFTARDLQSRSSQWMIGKTCDGFGLLGPYLVTADLVDPNNLKIVGTVNGEVRQSSAGCEPVVGWTNTASHMPSGVFTVTLLLTSTGSGAAETICSPAAAARPAASDNATKSRRRSLFSSAMASPSICCCRHFTRSVAQSADRRARLAARDMLTPAARQGQRDADRRERQRIAAADAEQQRAHDLAEQDREHYADRRAADRERHPCRNQQQRTSVLPARRAPCGCRAPARAA